mgnify:CR=1 FL=1
MTLQPGDRERLILYLDFLDTELADLSGFVKINWSLYERDRAIRRNLERWIENLINCSIDIAKVLLMDEGLKIPQTYRETLRTLGTIKPFNEAFGNSLARWAGLRNIIAHEYLDLSWPHIRKFLDEVEVTFGRLSETVRKIITAEGKS